MSEEKQFFSDHGYLPIGEGVLRMISVDVLLEAVKQNQEELLPEWVRRMIHWKLIAFGRGFAVLMDGGRGLSDEYLMLESDYAERGMVTEEKWLAEHTSFITSSEYEAYRRLA